MRLAQPEDELKTVALATSAFGAELGSSSPSPVKLSVVPPETAALPPSKPNDVHVQVEAPFVFRADDLPAAKPAPIREAELLQARNLPRPATFETEVLPPPQTQARSGHHGVFARIKGFFAAIFG
jgi:hypothetical protein